MTRVLFVSPYAAWHYHSALEATLARALELRGATVEILSCDGLFSACDVHRANLNPRGRDACVRCEKRQADAWSSLGRSWKSLGAGLGPTARAEVDRWAAGLDARELRSARWKDYAVGSWALSSALYQSRRSTFDPHDAECVDALRRSVRDTALACSALETHFDALRPDLVVTLNGRFFAQRVAVELARARGLRFATHERGSRADALMLCLDHIVHDLETYAELWSCWKETPLRTEEVLAVHQVLASRRRGQGLSWTRYSSDSGNTEVVRERLLLDQRPVVAVFGSSDDEVAAFPSWSQGAFPVPFEWMDGTLRLARARPDLQFVFRLHPALLDSGGSAEGLAEARKRLAQLPANARVVWPEDQLSSYALGDLASAVITTISTMGLEYAARGKPVLSTARGWYGHCPAVDFVSSEEVYAGLLDAALARGADLERARCAARFLWPYNFELSTSFDLVREEPRHSGQLRWSRSAELAPGRDAALDKLCELLLGQRAPWSKPDAEGRTLEQETEALLESVPELRSSAPAPSTAWIERAEVLWTQSRGNEACQALERALALDPRSARAWNDLGVVLCALGLHAEARQSFERALDCPGGSSLASENLAQLRELLEQA